jgi:DNA polymerase III epsilon subunit-like protein
VAICTTGPEPKQGHRIAELAAVEIRDGITGEALHLRIAPNAATRSDEADTSFSESIAQWMQFVAGSPLVVHDYYEFKRFLRAECKRMGVGFDITRDYPVIDTWLLAKERFPRQRHGLAAVIRKLGIEANPTALDALTMARMIACVADRLSPADYVRPTQRASATSASPSTGAVPAEQPCSTTIDVQGPMVLHQQQGLRARLERFWRQLTGREA